LIGNFALNCISAYTATGRQVHQEYSCFEEEGSPLDSVVCLIAMEVHQEAVNLSRNFLSREVLILFRQSSKVCAHLSLTCSHHFLQVNYEGQSENSHSHRYD
jgi:hypothetical protein